VVVSPARPVVALRRPLGDEALPREDSWRFDQLAGRLVQIDGAGDSAALTLACVLIREAQEARHPAVWIAAGRPAAGLSDVSEASIFYPPDADDNGVDLAALPVVRVPGVTPALSAADVLLRSGGFGLVVADLGTPPAVPSTVLARLAGLARRQHTAMIFLTHSTQMDAQGSLGSLISIHVRARRRRTGAGRYDCGIVALKDKHRGPAWQYVDVRHGAAGLR
jgi:hypothetical protein